jgi:hypothetical protein
MFLKFMPYMLAMRVGGMPIAETIGIHINAVIGDLGLEMIAPPDPELLLLP